MLLFRNVFVNGDCYGAVIVGKHVGATKQLKPRFIWLEVLSNNDINSYTLLHKLRCLPTYCNGNLQASNNLLI
jgi:hypothetical protein